MSRGFPIQNLLEPGWVTADEPILRRHCPSPRAHTRLRPPSCPGGQKQQVSCRQEVSVTSSDFQQGTRPDPGSNQAVGTSQARLMCPQIL